MKTFELKPTYETLLDTLKSDAIGRNNGCPEVNKLSDGGNYLKYAVPKH